MAGTSLAISFELTQNAAPISCIHSLTGWNAPHSDHSNHDSELHVNVKTRSESLNMAQ